MLTTSEGKWILFDAETGKQCEFWPIDGRTLLELGSHTAEPPAGVEVVAPPAPPAHAMPPQSVPVQTFVGPDGEAPPTAPKRGRKG